MGGGPGVPEVGGPRVPEQRTAVDTETAQPDPESQAELRFSVLGPVREDHDRAVAAYEKAIAGGDAPVQILFATHSIPTRDAEAAGRAPWPQILKRGDRLFLIYSASGCWTDHYALGMLSADASSDPLDAAAWTKSAEPVFEGSPAAGAYAPGHNSFFTSPDGREDWILYHANPEPAAPGMVFFLHMILMDSEANRAMTLGQTVVVKDKAVVAVEAMEGTLSVESVPGEGSVFWVELIRVSNPTETVIRSGFGGAPPVGRDRAERRATIVYVEDNLANLALIETILLDRPEVTLLPALQGTIGLDLAAEHRPDLILLDLHLPDMPGDEVLRRLRSNPRTRDVPVVIISADATPRRSESLLEIGASAYLTKPLNVDEFLGTIDRLLREREN